MTNRVPNKPPPKMIRLKDESGDAWQGFRAAISKENPRVHISDSALLSICVEIALAVVDSEHADKSPYIQEVPPDQAAVDEANKKMRELGDRVDRIQAELDRRIKQEKTNRED